MRRERTVMAYQPIENYGIIGDLHTVALVGIDGSIDFMCFPHFDSPTIFAALLDEEKGGRFQITPILCDPTAKQLYLPDTNILLTRFLSGDGVAEVSDFMPTHTMVDCHEIIRRVKCIRGEIHFKMICAPRFNYARSSHTAEDRGREILFLSSGDDKMVLRLRSSHPVKIHNGDGICEFMLRTGETATFILEDVPGDREAASCPLELVPEAFKDTVNFWRNWINRSRYKGRWREIVNRSALTLKLLFSEPHGTLVAAPTFGLPETIGGVRNWDYRYTWIRDASFTLYGLIRLGFTDEAAAFMKWLEERCGELNPDGSLQVMYGIDGRHDLTEEDLPHLSGYRQSSPVRIGNDAYNQLQLDIYGELMDSVYLYNKYGEPISFDLWENLLRLNDWVCENWRKPDEGIWEVRGGRKEFLYSRLMCWVSIDRAIRLAHKRSFPAPLDRWYRVRDEIYHDMVNNFWDRERGNFVQHRDSTATDASSLLMPLVKFIGPTDPRWLSTMRAIEEDLVYDSLVFRYKIGEAASDGLKGNEATFSMCTFWYVECLSRAGDLEKARFFFEKMLGYANHLGLYAEELSPHGEHLGNFPQAFTHLGLISAAHNLNRMLSGRNTDI
jgi:GH15 family glucan-1,4-alpha-glucosidase